MCTATWWHSPDGGHGLYFNRDEQRTRPVSEPVSLHEGKGIRYLAPRDGKSGGTWIAANEHGLVLALLNFYGAVAGVGPFTSRGDVIPRLVSSVGGQEAVARLAALPLETFAPFHVVALGIAEPARVVSWNGRELKQQSVTRPMMTSSSFDTERVVAGRLAQFDASFPGYAVDARGLELFHNQHDPLRGAESVCMARPDACTVSQTVVRVSPTQVTLEHQLRRGPEKMGPVETWVLPLSGAGGRVKP